LRLNERCAVTDTKTEWSIAHYQFGFERNTSSPLQSVDGGMGSCSYKWELPVAGTFVIDTKGVVRFAQVDPNFMTGRANPEAVLDILTKTCPHRG
jgi:hypothetical protein